MRRVLFPPALVFLVALGLGAPGHARAHEDAVYVYDLFQKAKNCPELFARLRKLPLRPTVILSIEQGPEFVLDRPRGEEQLTCVLRFLRGSARKVKALFLQDPTFLENSQEAVRRAALLGDYSARHPEELDGAQVDVEPHADTKWETNSPEERRTMLRNLQDLLRQVRTQLRGLPLGAAVPWWYASEELNLPEAAPGALFQVADELYLMVYGDPGEPPVGGSADSVLEHLAAAQTFSGGGAIYVVLAAHEFLSPAHLQAELKKVRSSLAGERTFAGTAVFHATSTFQVFPSSSLPTP